ncbi:MAG: flagellar hook-basal body complex protein FliE [Desulfobacterales bacterium]|nr:flagellar hook-basal body complex protein FliE [Desulfobacterales bacterium]
METITSINNSFIKPLNKSIKPNDSQGEISFFDRLKNSLNEVNINEHESNKAIEQVINGDKDIHEGMLTMQKADISLRLFVQMKNKVLEAYKEVMRMQV